MSKTLIQFHATWCGPCKRVTPIVEEIAGERTDVLTLKRVDIDEYPDEAARWSVQSVPTLILVDDQGMELERVVGAKPKGVLLGLLKLA